MREEINLNWYVIQSKPRKEVVAVENLERQGYSVYFPQIRLTKHRGKRWQLVTEALFPRYLFVNLQTGKDNFSPIRSTIGVQDLVRFGSWPATVSQQIIHTIREQERGAFEHQSNRPSWQAGDDVEITDGPFAGLKGIFQMHCGEERVIILLQMLGQSNKVTVALNSVVPVA